MFTNDITLNPTGQLTGASNVDSVYSLISLENQKAVRRSSANAIGAPNTLTISHETRKGKGYNYTGSSVKQSQVLSDMTSAQKVQIDCGFYLNVPQGTFLSDTTILTQVRDQVGRLCAFLRADGNLAKLLNAES